MPRIDYELTDFRGIHTAPGKTPEGHTYARDLLNLKIDNEGWLTSRSRITDFPIGEEVTGIATSPTHIFTLRTDGTLWVRDKNNVGQAIRTQPRTATLFARDVEEATEALFVTTAVDTSDDVQPQDLNNVLAYFEGRISLASFGDYVIITSEGNDQGVWVDMSQDLPVVPKVYTLGMDAPPIPTITAITGDPTTEILTNVTSLGHGYYVLITDTTGDVVRRLYTDSIVYPVEGEDWTERNGFAYFNQIGTVAWFWDGENQAGNRVVAGTAYLAFLVRAGTNEDDIEIEDGQSFLLPSQPPQNTVYFYRFTYIRETPETPFDGAESNPTDAIIRDPYAADNWHLRFSDFRFENQAQATHIGIYRATIPRIQYEDGLIDLQQKDLVYYQVAKIKKGESFWVDTFASRDIQRTLRFDNNRLPAEVKQLVVYNDVLFGAAGDRLVYSDLRFGNLAPWAFPEVNEIRLQGEVTFCATTLGELRGRTNVLLFGSRNQVARLSGINEADYAVDIMGHQGPVSPHAWTSQSGAIAYVGESGLFLTSGAQILMISDLALDTFFEDKKIIDGSVMFFQDNDMLFSVHTETENLAFKFEDGMWSRWDNIKMTQTAQMFAEHETYELFINENNRIQRILWDEVEGVDDAWQFESQILDFGGQASNRRKRFSQLQMIADTEEDRLTLETWIDEESEPRTITFRPRNDLYPSRVPIQRVGRRLKFRVSGNHKVTIQGIKIGVLI